MIELYVDGSLIIESTGSEVFVLSNEKLTRLNVAEFSTDPDYEMYFPLPKNWIVV